jgi:hypothetical protein
LAPIREVHGSNLLGLWLSRVGMWFSVVPLGVPQLGHTASFQILSSSSSYHSMPEARGSVVG